MALLTKGAVLLALAAVSAAQVCTCPPTPQIPGAGQCINDQPLDLGPTPVGDGPEEHILFIDYWENAFYSSNLVRIASILEREVKLMNSAGSVTVRVVDKTEDCQLASKLPSNLNAFTQIWVTDLESGTNEGLPASRAPCQYNRVAELVRDWYNAKQPEIIADGRVLSSMWDVGAQPSFTYKDQNGNTQQSVWDLNSLDGVNPVPNPADYATTTWPWPSCPLCDSRPLFAARDGLPASGNKRPGNANLFKNFFHHAVRAGNGLLFLGTDHNSYVGGINLINDQINLARFHDNYSQQPYAALADPASGIFHWPSVASHHPLDLDQTDSDTCPTRFIWDDSSTSYTPFNLQPSGRVMNTIAWHGTDVTKPAIATTLPSGVGFVINIIQPLACPVEFLQGDTLPLEAEVLQNPASGITSWLWEVVSIDEVGSATLCNAQSCAPSAAILTTFPGGAAQIRVTAVNSAGISATDYLCVSFPRASCVLPPPAIPDAVYTSPECLAADGTTVPDNTYCAPSCNAGGDLEVWAPPHCDNGNWAGGANCVPVRCHTRPPVANADTVALENCNELLVGSSCALANIDCNPGHVFQGSEPVCSLVGGLGEWTNVPICVPTSCNPGFFLSSAQACEACPAGSFKSGTGVPSECTLCPANTFNNLAGSSSCTPCATGETSEEGSIACSVCPLDWRHDWLATRYEPVLDDTVSGFNKYSRGPDWVSVVFDNPNKYDFQSSTVFSTAENTMNRGIPLDDVSASSPSPLGSYTNAAACYTRFEVYTLWGDLVQSCARDDTSSSVWVIYTCKLRVHNKETLNPIRNVDLERDLFSEIPFQVRFPKQVSATVLNLSAFQPPNVLAAIVRQAVRVNVGDLGDLSAEIDLYTSAQWPFKLITPTVVMTPTDIGTKSFTLKTECADAEAGDVANPTVDDANACGQVWLLDLDVAGGASSEPCELDGAYEVAFVAACQPSFDALTDCPLVQDDQGQIVNDFRVQFTIDSEYFCPTLVEQADLSASLKVYKDHAHTVEATNFVLGQTAYFVLETSSNKVSIASTHLNLVSIQPDGAAQAPVYNVASPGASACQAAPDAGATGVVNALVAEDGACETTIKTKAYFQFLVDETAMATVPVDGSQDFSVHAVVDVVFENAGLVMLEKIDVGLLQQATPSGSVRADGQSQRAETTFKVGPSDDTTTSPAVSPVSALVAAVVSVVAAQVV